ncbi:MAG: patatin-like phospholipase family protein [Caldilineaceae bacterium]|nr:patatin-like phospholipase family protein [Caldilineaceae bacterium]
MINEPSSPAYLTTDPTLLADLIIDRVTHILAKRSQAARLLLNLPPTRERPPLTAAALEETRPDWQELLPHDPALRGEVEATLAARTAAAPAAAPADPAVDDLLQPVTGALVWRYVCRGETLFRQGDPSEYLYILVDGRMRAVRKTADGDERILADYGDGRLLGESSLVQGREHETSAYALQDSDVCLLPLAALTELVGRKPQIMIRLLSDMATRMEAVETGRVIAPGGKVIAIVPASADVEAFARQLANALGGRDSVGLITPADAQAELAQYGGPPLEAVVNAYGFVDWLQAQAAWYSTLFYLADDAYPNWTRRVAEQADRLLIVGRTDDTPALSPAEQAIDNLDHPDLLPPRELALLRPRESDAFQNTAAWLDARTITRHHHVALDSGRGMDRLVRFVQGRAIGLVFGGGGMRAAACAGVARALEEMGIQADVVGGTSAGSIIAALYAQSYTVDKMEEVARTRLMQKRIWMQPTFPFTSVTSAERLNAAYREVFGDVMMEDLWIAPFTISGNLTRAEMTVHRRGPLHHAVRASTAIAGVMPPALTDSGDLLIDGGVFDNTPADVVRTMVDSGPVIAVDLGFTKRDAKGFAYGESLSGWKVLRRRLNPFVDNLHAPSIVSIMMRANALGSINAVPGQLAHADIVLRPPVGDYSLFDFDAYADIADAGYQYAREPLQTWVEGGGLKELS